MAAPEKAPPAGRPPDFVIGSPHEWRAFAARHPDWQGTLSRLNDALTTVFIRDVPVDPPGKHVAFALGRVALEDFAEVILLSGNGYGVGALKILRGMYERVVTALYLLKNPGEVDDFIDFDAVNAHKFLMHAKDSGADLTKLPSERVAAVKAKYDKVKNRYSGSWTKKDLKTRASEVGLGNAYGLMYFSPTLHEHASIAGLDSRFRIDEDGQGSFKDGPQRDDADDALGSAHALVLRLLEHFDQHFDYGIGDKVCALHSDFAACWKVDMGRDSATAP